MLNCRRCGPQGKTLIGNITVHLWERNATVHCESKRMAFMVQYYNMQGAQKWVFGGALHSALAGCSPWRVLINVIHLRSGEQPHCAYAGCYQFGIQHSLLIMMDNLENLIAIILHHRFPTYHKPLKYDVVERPTIKTSYCKWTVLFYFKWHHYSIAFSFLFCIWSILVDGYMPHHYQQKQQNLYSTQTCSCVTKV